jgi:hypothetical protein
MFIFGWPGKEMRAYPDGSKRVPRMAQPAVNGRSNILTRLDQRVPTRFYWQLTLLATLGGFLFGRPCSGRTSPVGTLRWSTPRWPAWKSP